jgi:tetratricopeptide (TPR) repeat protein
LGWALPIHLDPQRLAPAASSLVARAHGVAEERGDKTVSGEHLLRALLEDEYGAGPALEHLLDGARARELLGAVLPDKDDRGELSAPPRLSEPALAALLLAADYGEANGRLSVTCSDLVVGLLGVEQTVASEVLAAAGADDPAHVARVIEWNARNAMALASHELYGEGSAENLASRLADLDETQRSWLGARLLRQVNGGNRQHKAVAQRWITAHEMVVGDESAGLGPRGIASVQALHAIARMAYACNQEEHYATAGLELARAHFGWGMHGYGLGYLRAARRLWPSGLDDSDLLVQEQVAEALDSGEGWRLTFPDGVLPYLESGGADAVWELLLLRPELLSPAGLGWIREHVEDNSKSPPVRISWWAYAGSWRVAQELLRDEWLSGDEVNPMMVREAMIDTVTRSASNYVHGVPSDESRSSKEEVYSRFEFAPSDDVDADFVKHAAIALGHLASAETAWLTATYAVSFAQHAKRRAETVQIDDRLFELAVNAYALALRVGDPVDERFSQRAVALSDTLELRYRINGDIADLELAVTTLYETLYRLSVPDPGMNRLAYRLAGLEAEHLDALGQWLTTPEENVRAATDWPRLRPEYEEKALESPDYPVTAHSLDQLVLRLSIWLGELTDDEGRPQSIWGPGTRPGWKWVHVGDMALRCGPEQAAEFQSSVKEVHDLGEWAYRNAVEKATTQVDEAAGRFGLVEVARQRWLASRAPVDADTLLMALQAAGEHPEQMGLARLGRLSGWEGDVLYASGQSSDAVDAYLRALAHEEELFHRQAGLRNRVVIRAVEPSDVAARLALILAERDDYSGALESLERGRDLVMRALDSDVKPVATDEFLPKCGPVPGHGNDPGRLLERGSFRSVATLYRMGIRPRDEPTREETRTLNYADAKDALDGEYATLAYLIPGEEQGGLLLVGDEGASFTPLRALGLDRLTELEVTQREAAPERGRLDEWFTGFEAGAAAEVWRALESIPSDRRLYLVLCGFAAALPWSGAQPGPFRPVCHLGSARILTAGRQRGPTSGATARCQVLVADVAPGRTPLKFAQPEGRGVAAKWDTDLAVDFKPPRATVANCSRVLDEEEGICHVVCHAAASEQDPLQQGLALVDGVLLTGDILGREQRVRPRLVVLSACQSGRTAYALPNEFISLASALVARGAEGAIGNAWAVDDLTSAVVMEALHDLLASGFHPAEAIAKVQAACRAEDREFFEARSPITLASGQGAGFTIEELRSPAAWATLHYVGT